MNTFKDLCAKPGVFYLPRQGEDMEKWAMVACDQYTAQKDKWEQADAAVGGSPSALRLIIPEAYLDESDQQVPKVQAAMTQYLNDGILTIGQISGIIHDIIPVRQIMDDMMEECFACMEKYCR